MNRIKKHETIGSCGIDCGLCPRFHTKGDSACPGCGGDNFMEKHPSCGYLTCCAIKRGLEVCSLCQDYPCQRFDSEKSGYDSFVTHKKVFINLDLIRDEGIGQFIEQQKIRMKVLNVLLAHYDDGRSKSFYCIACALLPADKLPEILKITESLMDNDIEPKEKAKLLKTHLSTIADTLDISLRLNTRRTRS